MPDQIIKLALKSPPFILRRCFSPESFYHMRGLIIAIWRVENKCGIDCIKMTIFIIKCYF